MGAISQLNGDTKEKAKSEGVTLSKNGATPTTPASLDRPLSPTTTPSPQGPAQGIATRAN